MTRTIEVSFLGGPSAGQRPVEVTSSGRLPESITRGTGVFKLSASPNTWDGEYRWSEGLAGSTRADVDMTPETAGSPRPVTR